LISLLLLEFRGIFRRLYISIPIIIVPSIILYFSALFSLSRSVFTFSGVFVLQLLLLVSPIFLSELIRGGWRLLYQAGLFNKLSKTVLVIMFSSVIMTAPSVSLFTVVYFLLVHNNVLPFLTFIFLLVIGILSYSLGTFIKVLLNDYGGAFIVCLIYEAFLLPSLFMNYLYPDINFLTTFWPVLMLMNSVINISDTQHILELILISNFESFIIYLLLTIVSSWLLVRRVKL